MSVSDALEYALRAIIRLLLRHLHSLLPVRGVAAVHSRSQGLRLFPNTLTFGEKLLLRGGSEGGHGLEYGREEG